MKDYNINPDKSKIIQVHKDLNLISVQKVVSEKIFMRFYENYISSLQVDWLDDPVQLREEYLHGTNPDSGLFQVK